ncbi:MAG: dihydrolipoyl dehydrogenase [Planctomycetes bacterium RBG_16_64_10]|nr:MAG: dihydrolipoyl dehydrogenase [Planctomycetes bacterium RBG_16_64_10]
MHTQLAVLGGGPGGYAAAFMAADLGLEVTLVEAEARLGGTCLLRGCIPSKALLHVARVISEVDELREDWGVRYGQPEIDLATMRQRKGQVIDTLCKGLTQLAKRRQVRVIHAHGRFQDSATVQLVGDDASVPEDGVLTYDHLILATGSEAACPTALAVESPRVMDAAGALELADVPSSLLVVGGGYIGLEMGTLYAKLGSRVSLVELTDGLLPGADRNLVNPLHRRLDKLLEGRIFLSTRLGSLGERGDKVEAAFEGPEKFGTEHYDRVLVAVGRRPRTQGIGLENTKVELSHRGFVAVDAQQRTMDPQILAIGDVVGEPMLAHKASRQGAVAVEALLGHPAAFEPAAIPAVIFTDPEIAWAGLTEDQAKREGRRVSVATYPWGASGRAQALGRTEGLTKWIIDPASERLLGCGIVGSNAGELIAEAVLAIEMQCEVRDVVESIHPHPTLGETVRNAAEVFLGTATEIYKPRR